MFPTNMYLPQIKYADLFLEALFGSCGDTCKVVLKCANCPQKLRIIADKIHSKIRCPICNHTTTYASRILLMKGIGLVLILLGGCISLSVTAAINSYIDITGFYILFFVPIGAVILSILANLGVVSSVALARMYGINYSLTLLVAVSTLTAFSSFWLSQYLAYSRDTITVQTVSKIPPKGLEQKRGDLKQLEVKIKDIQSVTNLASNEIQTTESSITRLESAGTDTDRQGYQALISLHNKLVEDYNQNVARIKTLQKKYTVSVSEVNKLIDSYNAGGIGKKTIQTQEMAISQKYTFFEYIKKIYENRSFRAFGLIGKVPIMTPSAGIGLGGFGLVLLLLKQFGLLILPGFWIFVRKK